MTAFILWIHRTLVAVVLSPVLLYRRYLSPLKRTPTCIYLPTCSQYALDAVKTRGIVVGTALAVVRILRCNPLFHGGHDPVPTGTRRAATHACSNLDGACTAQEPH